MPGPAFLGGERLTLHAVTPDDAAFVAEHWNDPQIRRYTNQHDPQTASEFREMIEGSDDGFVGFLPCLAGDPVGYVWAFDVNDVAGHAEVGYWIVDEERGQGYATEAVDLLAEWAFEDRQLHRLQARVFAGNEASVRVLEKAGFEREGTLREAYRVEGEYVDATLFGLLAAER